MSTPFPRNFLLVLGSERTFQVERGGWERIQSPCPGKREGKLTETLTGREQLLESLLGVVPQCWALRTSSPFSQTSAPKPPLVLYLSVCLFVCAVVCFEVSLSAAETYWTTPSSLARHKAKVDRAASLACLGTGFPWASSNAECLACKPNLDPMCRA